MNTLLEVVAWVGIVLGIAGNFLVIKKSVWGLYSWTISNLCLIGYNAYHPSAQVFLFLVYLGFSIWGITQWQRKTVVDKEEESKLTTLSANQGVKATG